MRQLVDPLYCSDITRIDIHNFLNPAELAPSQLSYPCIPDPRFLLTRYMDTGDTPGWRHRKRFVEGLRKSGIVFPYIDLRFYIEWYIVPDDLELKQIASRATNAEFCVDIMS